MPSPSPSGYRGRASQFTSMYGVRQGEASSPVDEMELNRDLLRGTLRNANLDEDDQEIQHGDVDEGHSLELDDVDDAEDELDVLGEIQAGEQSVDEVDVSAVPPFDDTGLKDIGNLASWTVSTYKPGCGVEELRSEDTNLFWQSDGPQPHHLNIHFTRFVSIRAMRLYLDFEADESYTPTRIIMLGGTGYHDLTLFATLTFQQPKGWIDVNLEGVGGGADGNTLRAFLIQVKVVENHQNGKDTHLRGLKIYAADEKTGQDNMMSSFDDFFDVPGFGKKGKGKENDGASKKKKAKSMFTEPDWMKEPELR